MFFRNTLVAAFLTAFLLGMGVPFHLQAVQPKDVRIIVLPLNGDVSGTYAYLTDSIRTMLSTRLAAKDGITVVDKVLTADQLSLLDKSDVEADEYSRILDSLNTDYLVSGALYALQTGLKIQVNVAGNDIGVSGGGTFTSLAVSEDHILVSVEHLVEDIAVRALGVQDQSLATSAGGTATGLGVEGFSTEHPEKIFKKGVYGGTITAEDQMMVKSLGVRRSSELPSMLVAMASADLNGDGIIEIVAASRTSVEIFRFDDTRFLKQGAYDFPKDYKIHAVNVADLDGNGEAEIYVSGNDGKTAASAIFRWDGNRTVKPLLTDIGWYLRPLSRPGSGEFLAGQKGSVDPRTGYITGPVVSLQIKEDFSELAVQEELALPKNIRLFDFIWADLDNDGSVELVAIDGREKLLVYDRSNSLIFVSENDYGGSRNFYGPAKSAVTSAKDMIGKGDDAKADRPVLFIPTRLLAVDMNGDGKQEIIVGNNARTTPVAMVNFREYDGGSVVGLSWTDSEMVEVWKTNRIEGYIADYNLVTPDQSSWAQGGGQNVSSLYITQIPDKSFFGFSPNNTSKLLKYSLEIVAQE